MNVTADRIREHTSPAVNEWIDEEMRQRVAGFANLNADAIDRRIEQLDREWDTERVLETNASTLAFAGLMLGITRSRKWLIVPGIVLPLLFQHAVRGWCPPLPIVRCLGFRSRMEIDREKFALKAMRGDFGGDTPWQAALAAVNR